MKYFFQVALILLLMSIFSLVHAANSSVVCLAPSFSWQEGGSTKNLSSLRGQPVVLLIAPSPEYRAFRHQLNNLKETYRKLAGCHTIIAAAFTQEGGRISSNIPVVVVRDGNSVAAAYGSNEGFGIAIIGADGNLDCFSKRTLSGQRIYDLIGASYTMQQQLRRP